MDPTLTILQTAAVAGLIEVVKGLYNHFTKTDIPGRYLAAMTPLAGALVLGAYAVVPSADMGVLDAVVKGLAAAGGYAVASSISGSAPVVNVTPTVVPQLTSTSPAN